MRVTVICRSDSTGGAAVVSRRLTEALRRQGTDARLLVAEKLTDLPYVVEAGYPLRRKAAFLAERLQILAANGLNRRDLFKADTGSFGLPLWRHPAVKDADAVILNWVNQGMLSLKGVARILKAGKKVVWTMHDMWNLTGICHHAMDCRHFLAECGRCPLLGSHASPSDLSHRVWRNKKALYEDGRLRFVAVSNWLAHEARQSALLRDQDLHVIPNPFDPIAGERPERHPDDPLRILFAAATLDNWIKGLDTFRRAIELFSLRDSAKGRPVEILLMGALKDPRNAEGMPYPTRHLGMLTDPGEIADVYRQADIVANCSGFENLPGTLVEGQAYGAVPVAFDRGGQGDIITHRVTGYLAPWSDDRSERAGAIADGMEWAAAQLAADRNALTARMKRNVEERFSYDAVADEYLSLLQAPFNKKWGLH